MSINWRDPLVIAMIGAMATALPVVASIIVAILSSRKSQQQIERQIQTANRQTEELRRQITLQIMPAPIVRRHQQSPLLDSAPFELYNAGNGTAFDVQIDPFIVSIDGLNRQCTFQPIAMMESKSRESLTWTTDSSKVEWKTIKHQEVNLIVRCHDIEGHQYTRIVRFTLGQFVLCPIYRDGEQFSEPHLQRVDVPMLEIPMKFPG